MSTKNLTIGIVIVCALILGGYFIAKQPSKEVENGVEKPEQTPTIQNPYSNVNENPSQNRFNGEKGEKVNLVNDRVELEVGEFEGSKARFYNSELPSGKVVYFFVVRDKKGVFRAAANACQVCFDERKGFHQEGDYMVCNTCRSKYPLSKIATEKGGCNPGPINPRLEVQDGKVIIEESDLEEVAFFF